MNPVILIILGTIFMAGVIWLRSLPSHRRISAAIKIILLLLVASLVILTITGRIHWIGAMIAGAIILFQKYGFLLKAILSLRRKTQAKKQQANKTQRYQSHIMDRAEALKILGLDEGCSEEDVILAHRRLMQKLHPDHGGNAYLAAQLNEARQVLLSK
jgi:hypothetical protein